MVGSILFHTNGLVENMIPGTPLITTYNITGITQSKPGTVTLSAVTGTYYLPVALGQTISILYVEGMIQLNNNSYIVGNLNTGAMTFDLYDLNFNPVDTTGYFPYVSGGQINIYSFPASANNPPGLM